jgi:transcriptional regulator GlxA family with amidase domain
VVPLPAIGSPARGVATATPLVSVVADKHLPAPVARVRGGLAPRALRRVREYVDTHLKEKIRIESLAAVAGLSRFHFARAFKQSEGITPQRYLTKRRVRRVMELLAGTDLPLSEIAVAVGFSDHSHCARRFREHVGVCPRDYRWSTREVSPVQNGMRRVS